MNKVNTLESILFNLTQTSVTKREMQNMLKEELSPIVDVLFGKEKKLINESTQTSNQMKFNYTLQKEQTFYSHEQVKQTISNIKKIEHVIASEELNGFIYSLIETEDKRIASGVDDGSILISSYDVNTNSWNEDIEKENAHDGSVTSLCTLKGNRLLSGSVDSSIKIWMVSLDDLTPLKVIKKHSDVIRNVISLSNERFASCSEDKTVRIWKDDNKYKNLATLKHEGKVISIRELKKKTELISCGKFVSPGLTFWDLNDYSKRYNINGYSVEHPTHIIELSNGNIVLSTNNNPFPLVIIDSSSYTVKKKIYLEQYILAGSSLCEFRENSFIYVYNGSFLQISNDDYSILFHKTGNKFKGFLGGVITIKEGKYFAIQNCKSISIIKPYGDETQA
jgi:WD40 repeat protein